MVKPGHDMEPLKLHWASSKKNFGDWLSPALCAHLSQRDVVHASPERCELLAIGSILGRLGHGWLSHQTTVWGSGFIEDQPAVSSKHRYCAVRGHRTAGLLKRVSIEAFGDPGLLCGLLVPDFATIAKAHPVGIIPHYKDREDPSVAAFVAAHPGAVMLDVFTEPATLLRRVAQCEFVLSSSLHGLVVADAFGIANAWVEISGGPRGHRFKFLDYYSVFGIHNPNPLHLRNGVSERQIAETKKGWERPGLTEIQKKLIASFPFPPKRVSAVNLRPPLAPRPS
jgi:pyruvyltransferase